MKNNLKHLNLHFKKICISTKEKIDKNALEYF